MRQILACCLLLSPLAAFGGQTLHGHVPAATAVSKRLGPMLRSERLSLAVGLPLRNPDDLDALIEQLIDPDSPNFRRYLTAEQFADRFGPSEQDYQALIDFFTARGLQVTGLHSNRMILDINGAAADIEATFHIRLMRYEHAARGVFFAPAQEPSIDSDVPITDISGLDNFAVPRPMDLRTRPLASAIPLTTGSGPAGLFTGGDFRAAYAPNVTLSGAGQTVGLFELDGFYSSDVQANFRQAGLAAVPVTTVLLDGFSGAPGGANVEVMLDIMMAAYMAPGLSKIIVYEGTNWNDVLNRMATDNAAKQLSSSWCFYPTNATTEQIFKQMIAQGQSLFQASGDSGAYGGWIMPPADDPNVTVVGGTSLTTTVPGGPWKSETTWPGSGGGASTTWPIPSYQPAASMAAAGGSSSMRNIPDVALTADVQLFLICNNGQWIQVGGTSAAAPLWAGFMALVNQQAASMGKPAVGFLNPLIYKIGAGSNFPSELHDITTGNNSGFAARTGYDLATGWGTPAGQKLIDDLTGVSAAPGFTLSLNPLALTVAAGTVGETAVSITPQNGFSGAVSLTAAGLPAGVTATFGSPSTTSTSSLTLAVSSAATAGTYAITFQGASGSMTSAAQLALTVTGATSFTITASPSTLSLPRSGTSTSTISVTPKNGFTGPVSFTATGMPSGVTATLNPAATTGSTTVTLSATASAALGAATVTVTGLSGSLRSSATLTLTVTAPAPGYTIAATPVAVAIVQGGTGTCSIAVVPQNGFNGTVALSASNLPAGVTAAFSPSSTTKTSTLTLSAPANAALGATTITVTGTSGALASKATLTLTVNAPPSFTLAASPASLSLKTGSTGKSTITVNGQNAFNGSVNLSATGLPSGVTAAFSPASTKTSSTLTLTASTSAAAGPATVTVTGVSGSISNRVTIAVTVVPPPGFTLAATSASVSLAQGASAASAVAVTALNGFASPVTFAASGLPTGVTATFNPSSSTTGTTATFTASKTAKTGAATVTITGTSASLTAKTTLTVTVGPPPTFTLAALPSSLSIAIGSAGDSTLAVTPQNGFASAVALSVSGLPAGVTASFTAGSSSVASTLTLTVTAAASAGTSTLSVTGKAGSLSQTASITLKVLPATAGNILINLAPLYNVPAMVTDGAKFTSGGFDGGGRAYSASQLGTVVTAGGVPYSLGPANAPGAISSATVSLPPGQYSSLRLLAAAVNGNQTAQTFTVTYSDGSTSVVTQSLSDWCTPQGYPGESNALNMFYRDNSDGTRDTRTVELYGYSFNLMAGKTVTSIALPKNRNVVVLAISLSAASL